MTAAMNSIAADLLARINNCQAKIGVVGLGYVGLPLAHALHQGGLHILGFDIDQSKIDAIKAGRNYLVHLGAELVTTVVCDWRRQDASGDAARCSL